MDTPLMSSLRIKQVTPRIEEMMNRLVAGQKPSEIQKDMGVSPSRWSIISGSPLFKLVLRKKMMRREGQLVEIQENFLSAAVASTRLHKDILEAGPGIYTTEVRLKSAAIITPLVARHLLGSQSLSPSHEERNGEEGGDEREQPYEERLKEVIYRESIKLVTPQPPSLKREEKEESTIEAILAENYPPEDSLPVEDEGEERRLLLGSFEPDEPFELTPRIEDILRESGEKVR